MSFRSPPVLHTLLEGRTLLEFSASTLSLPLLLSAPKGDGHPVMVFPGFLASDLSTKALRQFLKVKGYRAEGWGLGRNLGQHVIRDNKVVSNDILDKVLSLYERTGEKVSLIGWSLGGILAREIARLLPEQTRCVVTLGSPFNAPEDSAPMAATLFKILNNKRMGGDFSIPDSLTQPLSVPTTAIFSRSDGVAHWHGCKHHENSHTEQSENVEVVASHLGLGHHPAVLWAIATRLSLPTDTWTPLASLDLPKWLFPNPDR